MLLKVLISILPIIYTVYANGEFLVLHHPNSVSFKGHDRVKESLLKDVFAASLGFSVEGDSNWQGMYIQDPFSLAEAIAVIMVDGVPDLDQIKGHSFSLRTDGDGSEIYRSVEKTILERYPSGGSQLVYAELSEGLESVAQHKIFNNIKNINAEKIKTNHLKRSVDEDREFLQELALLNAIAKKIEAGVIVQDYIPDIFWFKISNLHAVIDLHGENSTVTKEAKQLLSEAIARINNAFKKCYNGNVLVSIIASDASHTRRTRNILETRENEQKDPFSGLNLSKAYTSNYPVVFNILLWFGVVMVFSLLAISIAIANMDPGRDSIIYRMTSTRMKKDN